MKGEPRDGQRLNHKLWERDVAQCPRCLMTSFSFASNKCPNCGFISSENAARLGDKHTGWQKRTASSGAR